MRQTLNCPRCNYVQAFGERKTEVEPGIFEVFIQCKACKWKHLLFRGSSANILNEKEIKKLKVKALRDPQLYGVLKKKLKKRNDYSS
jgi:hypothetical protein